MQNICVDRKKKYDNKLNIVYNLLKVFEMEEKKPLFTYEIIAECKTTKARVGKLTLVHHTVDMPVFMPIGTQVCLLKKLFSKNC